MPARPPLAPRFGTGSRARHRRLAVARGRAALECMRPELAFDLDTPEDLARWPRAAWLAAGSVGSDAIVGRPIRTAGGGARRTTMEVQACATR
jgi:hypothetical protein